MSEREISCRYDDPLDLIWLRAAQRLGMSVVRSTEVYASWDGEGTLSVAVREHFDPDDCLAQMIFHELCHALVAGGARHQRDWGLSNTSDEHLVFEHACHRLQATLASRYGLREFMAVTTQWRPYWDALPPDPLAECPDPAREIALRAYERAQGEPWRGTLHSALEATARLAAVLADVAPDDSLWRRARRRHITGLLMPEVALDVEAEQTGEKQRCGDCTWSFSARPGQSLSCRQSARDGEPPRKVAGGEAACERWEPKLSAADCGRCGACCREGFDLVPVGVREPFARKHRTLVQRSSFGLHVPRPGGRCGALDGDGTTAAPFACRHYADRPRSCAQFPVAGDACLLARRRVGLSR
jgi:Putative zinc- or iron-chelating domain